MVTSVDGTWQERVRVWLENNERSQAWLARKAKLDPSWLYLTLSGKRPAGNKTLRKLEHAMGMPEGTLGQLPMLVDGGTQ